MLKGEYIMSEVSNIIELLEKAKGELDDMRLEKIESANPEDQDQVEGIQDYIQSIQLVIDTLSDDELFVSKISPDISDEINKPPV